MADIANAEPAKEFFIRMLTRDISLSDCVLDLLDNAVDGARRPGVRNGEGSLEGFWIRLELAEDRFSIADNCGGISVADAKDYAFNFGRRADAPVAPGETIGIYGIGMKRAMFKLGGDITVTSSTKDESFSTQIEVEEWEKEKDWHFSLETGAALDVAGTMIEIAHLRPGVGETLADPAFQKRLSRSISRGYSRFLRNGLEVRINGTDVKAEYLELLVGDEFAPARVSYEDDGVRVEITAGMAAPPQSDDSADAKIPHYHLYGWYVVCNDRVVLAGDKSDKTVWGHDGFNNWHNQYNGFLGVVSFHTDDAAALPWTTTKRDLDASHPVYRRAVTRMKNATKPFLEYTNVRKDQEQRVAELERTTKKVALADVPESDTLKLPKIEVAPKVTIRNILYRKPEAKIKRLAEALGNRNLSFKEVGSRSFEYCYEREVGED